MQKGHVFQAHGSWHIRYRLPDGTQKSEKLTDYNEQYRTKKSVRQLAEDVIHRVLHEHRDPSTLQDFIELRYLPHTELHVRPSTFRGYRNLFRRYKPYLASYKIAEFKTRDGQAVMNKIAKEIPLTHQTLIHIKSFLSKVFRHARRQGVIGSDPIEDVQVPRGRESKDTEAYTYEQVKTIIDALDGVARVAVVVAAHTALSLGELQGLRWEDIGEGSLTVNRTIWRGTEGPPKTKARRDSVPLLPVVKQALDEHRRTYPETKWVFEGPYLKPFDLATLGSKSIKSTLAAKKIEWHGWHAFRRGFASRLAAQNVPPKTLQLLLRHSSFSVTMKHYVKANEESKRDAIQQLQEAK
jgi:integrase